MHERPLSPFAAQRRSTHHIIDTAVSRKIALGSAAIGFLYDVSLQAAVAFCVATGIASLPFFFAVRRKAIAIQ